MTVLAPDISAVVEPLAVIQEGQIAGTAMRVPLNRVDLWGSECERKDFLTTHNAPETGRVGVVAVNRAELKYPVCFLSDSYNQTHAQNAG